MKQQNASERLVWATDWPTLALAGVIYGGWMLATLIHNHIPPLLLATVGGWLIAWHGSLQHEAIHGHPTRSQRLNALLATPPLSLWLPFEAYRQSHLAHHATEHLTDPEHDPESRYPLPGPGAWRSAARWAAWIQSTLLARLVLGPVFEIVGFLGAETACVAHGDWARLRLWAWHGAAVAAVVFWLHVVCAMSLIQYTLCFVYPGCALSLIRSFAEHRAASDPAHRVAVVEKAPLLGLLFLNNNLHAAHHERPGLAWHRLPRFYAGERERLLAGNGGLVYTGYKEVFGRYLLRPHDARPVGAANGNAG